MFFAVIAGVVALSPFITEWAGQVILTVIAIIIVFVLMSFIL
jgi:hypothetical protein